MMTDTNAPAHGSTRHIDITPAWYQAPSLASGGALLFALVGAPICDHLLYITTHVSTVLACVAMPNGWGDEEVEQERLSTIAALNQLTPIASAIVEGTRHSGLPPHEHIARALKLWTELYGLDSTGWRFHAVHAATNQVMPINDWEFVRDSVGPLQVAVAEIVANPEAARMGSPAPASPRVDRAARYNGRRFRTVGGEEFSCRASAHGRVVHTTFDGGGNGLTDVDELERQLIDGEILHVGGSALPPDAGELMKHMAGQGKFGEFEILGPQDPPAPPDAASKLAPEVTEGADVTVSFRAFLEEKFPLYDFAHLDPVLRALERAATPDAKSMHLELVSVPPGYGWTTAALATLAWSVRRYGASRSVAYISPYISSMGQMTMALGLSHDADAIHVFLPRAPIHGAYDLIILDDVTPRGVSCESYVMWVVGLLARLSPHGSLVIGGKAWGDDDLAPTLLLGNDDLPWEVTILPALIDDLPTWPGGRPRSDLEKIRSEVGEENFANLWMGRALQRGRDFWGYFDSVARGEATAEERATILSWGEIWNTRVEAVEHGAFRAGLGRGQGKPRRSI